MSSARTATAAAADFDNKKDEDENLGKTKMGACQKCMKILNLMVLVGEICALFINAAFITIAVLMFMSPLKKHVVNNVHDKFAYKAFWGMQGGVLLWGALLSMLATVYFGLLNKKLIDLPKWLKAGMWCGFFQYELGRAIFLFITGAYVYAVMSAFEMVHLKTHTLWWLCKLTGAKAVLLGIYMFIFDVCFDCLETPRFHSCGGRRQDPKAWKDEELGQTAVGGASGDASQEALLVDVKEKVLTTA